MRDILADGYYARYVQEAAFPNAALPSDKSLAIFALGVAGEAGEVAELVKKYFDRERPLSQEEIKLELGDVLWYLQALATYFGLTLNEIAKANVDKLNARKAAA